ncbi:MAG: dockerin type I domain-containing protein [Planctomycetota bacterium]|jgi:hypothetical protein
MKTHLQIVAWSAAAVLMVCGVASAYDYGYDPAKDQGGGLYMELAQDPSQITAGVYSGKYEYFFDLYTTGGTLYYTCILGLDNSKIANALTTTPANDTPGNTVFRTQEWGDPNGYPNCLSWAVATGRILDFWSKDVNASLAAANVPDKWRTSYDDGAGGWTDTGLGYAGSSTSNPHSYSEYVEHSGFGGDMWKAELTGPGQALQWQLSNNWFGDEPTQDVILIYGDNSWATHGNGGVFATVRVVYDDIIDPANISWGSASAGSTPILGDFTMYVPPMPGDFNDDDLVNTTDIDLLRDAIAASSTDLMFDVNGDTVIDELDLIQHIATLVQRTDSGVGTYRGDFNLDGYVDGTDLAILKAGFGLTGLGYAAGNCNADTFIDGTDLAIFKATFGFSGTPGGGNPPAVPEPATVGLLALGGLAVLRRRSR